MSLWFLASTMMLLVCTSYKRDVTCLIYILGLRLLKDDETVRGFLANDPLDALKLRINHEWPTCCGRNDGPIIYA